MRGDERVVSVLRGQVFVLGYERLDLDREGLEDGRVLLKEGIGRGDGSVGIALGQLPEGALELFGFARC